MKIESQKISPEKAREFLQTNIEKNRPVRENKVLAYAREIIEGRWVSNSGETIKFDKKGNLFDGQHRLRAIILSNKTISLLVAYECDEEAKFVVDTGATRSGGDTLHIQGVKNAMMLGAGIKYYHGILNNRSSPGDISKQEANLSNYNLLKTYDQDPEFWQQWSRNAASWYLAFNKILPTSFIFGVATYLARHSKYPQKIILFFDELCHDGQAKFEGIKILRKKYLDDKVTQTTRLTPKYRYIYLAKVWNAYVKNTVIKRLSVNLEEETPTLL